MPGPKLYLEDLQVGQRFVSGRYQMDAERMKEFAANFDPQPFHLDESAGEQSVFKGLAASGWHTAAATMRMLLEGDLIPACGLIGMGGEINWPRPTRSGDTLHVESEVLEIIPSRSKPGQGVARIRNTTLNQNGEVVQVFTVSILLFRKNPA